MEYVAINFEDVSQVVEAWGSEQANEFLVHGWKLLAVVQGTVPHGGSHIKYVLGKPVSPRPKKSLADML